MYKLKIIFFSPQITMKLYIPKVLVQHFGVYACKAKNPRGDTDGIITLSGNILIIFSTKIKGPIIYFIGGFASSCM